MELIKMKKEIFREYDIRGIYPSELDVNGAYTFGRSFASYVTDKRIIVGYDNRESSGLLHEALIKGLLESGANILDIGLVTTPMYYYAKKKFDYTNGIMITASHNPREYNGFKISFSKIGNAFGKDIMDFYDYTNKLDFVGLEGSIDFYNIREDYLNNFKNSIDLGPKKIKAVIDCGNGTGSVIVHEIMKMFDNIECEYLYCDSDPRFPNHHPDPSVKENNIDLANKVKELGYDIGIGIDGDADRVGIVLENGEYISADLVMLIFYRALNNKMKNRKAVFDVKCSKTLIDGLEDMNMPYEMYRTGASYLNYKANTGDYDFAGEFSGHLVFRDKYPGFDDGIYAGVRLIEVLSNTNLKASELLNNTSKYYQTEEIKVPVTDDNKFEIVNKVKNYCINNNYPFIDIDGVRVTFDDSWALVRASNTGPNLTIRFEAKTEDRLNELQEEFMRKINEYKGM